MPQAIRVRLMRRRMFIVSTVALLAGACAPSRPQGALQAAALPPEFGSWRQEAEGMLSDVLESLQTFDTFHAFRVSTTDGSRTRLGSELAWDPPSSAAWDEASHVTRGLHGRAQQLFQNVTTAQLDTNVWRQQRELADAAHDLLDLSEALTTYRDQIDLLPPGDASNANGLLEGSWTQWDAAAARWGVARSEFLTCGT